MLLEDMILITEKEFRTRMYAMIDEHNNTIERIKELLKEDNEFHSLIDNILAKEHHIYLNETIKTLEFYQSYKRAEIPMIYFFHKGVPGFMLQAKFDRVVEWKKRKELQEIPLLENDLHSYT